MPLFGSKKKKDKKKEKGADMESSEDDGLFMARGSDAASPEKAAALSLEDGDGEPDPDIQTEDEAPGLSVLDGGPEETSEPAAPAAAEEPSNADDLLSAFDDDDDSGGELAELTKDLEDVPMAELLAELREIRMTLPPEVLESGEDVA